MPAVYVLFPNDLFNDVDRAMFKATITEVVALCMDAINPQTGVKTDYQSDPSAYIDLVLQPVEPENMDTTAVCLATIVTYNWPNRMINIQDRIRAITEAVAPLIPRREGILDRISFTFLGKEPGAWHAA